MNAKEIIGFNIKKIRKQNNLTQEQLSELVGINVKYLSGIERGKKNPTLDIILKITDALNVRPNQIINYKIADDPETNKSELISIIKSSNNDQLKLIYKLYCFIKNNEFYNK